MKILRNSTTVFRNASGQILKLQDDNYIEPKPNVLQVEIQVDAGQVFTLPTINSFTYINTLGASVSSGTLVYDYVVDWGDGTSDTITTFDSALRAHTYTLAGKYVIEITSATKKFPSWDCSNTSYSAIRPLITRVISWGDIGIKKINFYGCTALVTIPEQRSKLTTLLTAVNFCYGCTSLTAIPYGTFFKTDTEDIVIADFGSAFYNCSKLLSVHSTTFVDCIYARLFSTTFFGCTKLASIPAALFYSCPNVTSFSGCFRGNVEITSIPSTLFLYNTYSSCSFQQIFYGCTKLASVPSGLFDTVHSSDFSYAFYGNSSLTTIPEYLFAGQNLCTSFYSTFYSCYKLTGVPAGVFDISVGGVNACLTMQHCFQGCGTDASITTFTIANNLFDDLYKVTNFYGVFQSCSKFVGIPTDLFINCVAVTTFAMAFYLNKHITIPVGLFDSCTEVTTFAGCFAQNTSLTSAGIPAYLFASCTKVVSFGDTGTTGVFSGCNNVGFTSIPATLFSNCTSAQTFRNAFSNCTNLESIPTDLFRYNTVMTDAAGMFAATKISTLTANTFQYNPSITTVAGCFANLTSLTSVDEDLFNTHSSLTNAIVDFSSVFSGCNNVGFTSIPEGLFRYSVNAKLFGSAFLNCTKIASIPSGLFQYNTILENLSSCFSGWTVSSIPSTLFAGLSQVSTVNSCFIYNHELLSIPAGLFDDIGVSRTVDFTSCFRITGTGGAYNKITGAVPELWLKPNSPTGTQCFYNRTAVSNYTDIPAGWK
jgi:hypothetical protein